MTAKKQAAPARKPAKAKTRRKAKPQPDASHGDKGGEGFTFAPETVRMALDAQIAAAEGRRILENARDELGFARVSHDVGQKMQVANEARSALFDRLIAMARGTGVPDGRDIGIVFAQCAALVLQQTAMPEGERTTFAAYLAAVIVNGAAPVARE